MDDDAPGSIVLLGEIVFVHQNCPTQELIHYNFSAEWAIQSFMSALCMLFTDGTYEAHLAVIISNGSQRGTFWKLQHKQQLLRWTSNFKIPRCKSYSVLENNFVGQIYLLVIKLYQSYQVRQIKWLNVVNCSLQRMDCILSWISSACDHHWWWRSKWEQTDVKLKSEIVKLKSPTSRNQICTIETFQ